MDFFLKYSHILDADKSKSQKRELFLRFLQSGAFRASALTTMRKSAIFVINRLNECLHAQAPSKAKGIVRQKDMNVRRSGMKKIVLFTMVLLLTAGIVYAKDHELKKKTGGYDVLLKFQKSTFSVGDNPVSIEIMGTSGHQVSDAKVELYYFMPSMPAMNYTAGARLEKNRYNATVSPTMGGDWKLDLKFTRPGGKTRKVTFSFKAK